MTTKEDIMMKPENFKNERRCVAVIVCTGLLVLTGCNSHSSASKGAKEGAAYGALGGATAGFLRGLIHGDALGRAAEGALVGAGTGAVVGGVHGSKKDADLEYEFGKHNATAIMALVHRDYPAARTALKKAETETDPTYKLATYWIDALIAKETLEKEALTPYLEKLIECLC